MLFVYFLIMVVAVVLDQLSKVYAANNLAAGVTQHFVHPILNFHYHENRGAAWGILADHPWVFMVLSSVAILAIIAFLIFYRKAPLSPFLKTGLAMVAGGGIGNMIDRIAQGYVVDFLEFGFFDFPIFNVADSFVTVGAFLILIYLLIDLIREIRNKKKKATAEKTEEAAEQAEQTEAKEDHA